jgi:hypothetical protein
MEHVDSLQCSQLPTTGPYPKSDEYSLRPHTLFY